MDFPPEGDMAALHRPHLEAIRIWHAQWQKTGSNLSLDAGKIGNAKVYVRWGGQGPVGKIQ